MLIWKQYVLFIMWQFFEAVYVRLRYSMFYLLKQNPQSRTRSHLPKTRFSVMLGSRYRFRIINAVSVDCPLQLQIESHNMTIIASDGAPVKSRATSHLLLFPGIICFIVITISIIRCTNIAQPKAATKSWQFSNYIHVRNNWIIYLGLILTKTGLHSWCSWRNNSF